ncbi:MAG TPA: GspMb/PilO family protein [Candidatus Omnitrophota bacterium]|nr:GspMb/PilO family protein [Candidatus Omnitrophota bacterium]HPT07934.1 GspMb/PilO family protein [Candidatus Omnitrophota bacterium]
MIKQLQALTKLYNSFTKKEKLLVYVTFFIIAATLLDRLIILPVYSKIKSLNSQIKEREISITNNLHILAQQDRIEQEIKSYSSFLHSSATDEENMTTVLKRVEELANKSSLYIVDMKPGGTKENKDKTKKYVVSLSCEGQMEQVMTFLYNVESAGELLMIEKYQINPKTKDSSVAQCVISIAKIVL